ncbi:D-glucuronyl C5-epimerase family protein, partial [Candidatus Latescibacterota bacterium]
LLAFLASCLSCDNDSKNPVSPDRNTQENPFSSSDSLVVDDFLGYQIERSETGYLNTYDLQNAESLAESYRKSGMEFFVVTSPYKTLDENNVPIVHYWFGEYRNPVTTCHTAFGYYRYYMETLHEGYKQSFLNNIKWLYENCDDNYYLRYQFNWEHVHGIDLLSGWISAMAQGEALAAMCMAYNLTGSQKYLKTAEGLFTTLYKNTDTTWCYMIDGKGYYWLEEYPNGDFCHVLNGFLFGLWGIWDYYVITGDEFALTLFEAGIKSILDNLSFWNIEEKDMSKYCSHIIVEDYHVIHQTQFKAYADLLNIPEFNEAAELFIQTAAP